MKSNMYSLVYRNTFGFSLLIIIFDERFSRSRLTTTLINTRTTIDSDSFFNQHVSEYRIQYLLTLNVENIQTFCKRGGTN